MRAAAFSGACAALGLLLGYVTMALACQALSGQPRAAAAPSGRDVADLVGDVEGWLRGEGY